MSDELLLNRGEHTPPALLAEELGANWRQSVAV